MPSHSIGRSIEIQFNELVPLERESRVAQNKDLVADAQTLLEENLSEKKSVESARRLLNIDNLFYTCYSSK